MGNIKTFRLYHSNTHTLRFVCLYVCLLEQTRKTILRLLCWEASEPPGSGYTWAEAQTIFVLIFGFESTQLARRVQLDNYKMAATTTKWQQEAPSWSTILGLRLVYTEKRRSSRRARVQEELNLPVWERKSQSRRHHDEPSHNYKMAAKSVIMIHYLRAAACLYREAKEFKKILSSRRSQHDPLS